MPPTTPEGISDVASALVYQSDFRRHFIGDIRLLIAELPDAELRLFQECIEDSLDGSDQRELLRLLNEIVFDGSVHAYLDNINAILSDFRMPLVLLEGTNATDARCIFDACPDSL